MKENTEFKLVKHTGENILTLHHILLERRSWVNAYMYVCKFL